MASARRITESVQDKTTYVPRPVATGSSDKDSRKSLRLVSAEDHPFVSAGTNPASVVRAASTQRGVYELPSMGVHGTSPKVPFPECARKLRHLARVCWRLLVPALLLCLGARAMAELSGARITAAEGRKSEPLLSGATQRGWQAGSDGRLDARAHDAG